MTQTTKILMVIGFILFIIADFFLRYLPTVPYRLRSHFRRWVCRVGLFGKKVVPTLRREYRDYIEFFYSKGDYLGTKTDRRWKASHAGFWR
jgi:hypothetical protein